MKKILIGILILFSSGCAGKDNTQTTQCVLESDAQGNHLKWEIEIKSKDGELIQFITTETRSNWTDDALISREEFEKDVTNRYNSFLDAPEDEKVEGLDLKINVKEEEISISTYIEGEFMKGFLEEEQDSRGVEEIVDFFIQEGFSCE